VCFTREQEDDQEIHFWISSSTENKIYSPSLHKESSIKQRGYSIVLPSSVIGFSLLQSTKIFKTFQKISVQQKMVTPLGTVFFTDEKAVAQTDFKLLGRSNCSSSILSKRSSNSFSPRAPLAPNQCGSIAYSFQRLALKSLRRLLKERILRKLIVCFLTKKAVQPLMKF